MVDFWLSKMGISVDLDNWISCSPAWGWNVSQWLSVYDEILSNTKRQRHTSFAPVPIIIAGRDADCRSLTADFTASAWGPGG